MKLVIDILEEHYNAVKNGQNEEPYSREFVDAIVNGTPLPKGHGDLIDRKLALSDDGLCEFHMYDDYVKMRNYLKSIPTIIEADKESKDEAID